MKNTYAEGTNAHQNSNAYKTNTEKKHKHVRLKYTLFLVELTIQVKIYGRKKDIAETICQRNK